jgi:hypothetical protein
MDDSGELKSMKIEKSEADKLYGQPSVMADQPMYPYGLQLHLDDASLGKLGISQLPKVGEKMIVLAVVDVSSASASEHKGEGVKQGLGLQITEMCLHPYDEKLLKEEKSEVKSEEMQQDKGVSPDAFYSAGPELRG